MNGADDGPALPSQLDEVLNQIVRREAAIMHRGVEEEVGGWGSRYKAIRETHDSRDKPIKPCGGFVQHKQLRVGQQLNANGYAVMKHTPKQRR